MAERKPRIDVEKLVADYETLAGLIIMRRETRDLIGGPTATIQVRSLEEDPSEPNARNLERVASARQAVDRSLTRFTEELEGFDGALAAAAPDYQAELTERRARVIQLRELSDSGVLPEVTAAGLVVYEARVTDFARLQEIYPALKGVQSKEPDSDASPDAKAETERPYVLPNGKKLRGGRAKILHLLDSIDSDQEVVLTVEEMVNKLGLPNNGQEQKKLRTVISGLKRCLDPINWAIVNLTLIDSHGKEGKGRYVLDKGLFIPADQLALLQSFLDGKGKGEIFEQLGEDPLGDYDDTARETLLRVLDRLEKRKTEGVLSDPQATVLGEIGDRKGEIVESVNTEFPKKERAFADIEFPEGFFSAREQSFWNVLLESQISSVVTKAQLQRLLSADASPQAVNNTIYVLRRKVEECGVEIPFCDELSEKGGLNKDSDTKPMRENPKGYYLQWKKQEETGTPSSKGERRRRRAPEVIQLPETFGRLSVGDVSVIATALQTHKEFVTTVSNCTDNLVVSPDQILTLCLEAGLLDTATTIVDFKKVSAEEQQAITNELRAEAFAKAEVVLFDPKQLDSITDSAVKGLLEYLGTLHNVSVVIKDENHDEVSLFGLTAVAAITDREVQKRGVQVMDGETKKGVVQLTTTTSEDGIPVETVAIS